uniref:Uncharacterized protein n=1 Tax=uncultured bacterium contig00107 TaxID=1181573 RepID=A0A806KLL0_9BACT|nr:hypothetical protein [uncultured bacterium contig00107]
MTITEVRAIREKQSLETVRLTTEDLRAYFAEGAGEIQRMIDETRKERETELAKTISVAL